MRCETIKKKSIVIYIFTVGTILGVLSIFSDIIPYQLKDESIFEMILFILGGLMNNLAIWFLLSMILGYKFCNSLRCSVINGGYFCSVCYCSVFHFQLFNNYGCSTSFQLGCFFELDSSFCCRWSYRKHSWIFGSTI